MCPDDPTGHREDSDNSYSNNCVVQCLTGDRVRGWEAEDDSYETDPGHGDESYGTREQAQIERPFARIEFFSVDQAD